MAHKGKALGPSRRTVLSSIAGAAMTSLSSRRLWPMVKAAAVEPPGPSQIRFEETAAKSGLHFVTRNSASPNKDQIETMVAGVALFDYDGDGLLDVYLVNGAEIPSLEKSSADYWNRLFHNNGDGTFTDVTEKAGVAGAGYGMGVAVGDYDNDGHADLFLANVTGNQLFHNNGDGTFTDVSEKAGMWTAIGTYGLSVAASDLDNDGWPDIYVANDSAPATLYLNQKDGTFRDIAIEAGAALSAEAKPQAGMGVSIGDYNRDGNLDVVKTNFAGDTDSLYTNLGDANFEDRTYPSGLGVNTRLLGWGVGFFDMDNDGWLDILMSNGHVYPEVDKSNADLKYAEHKYLYRNLRNGRFEEVTNQGGPGILENAPARGTAFGDYNNDGVIDIAVNCINAPPQLLRCISTWNRNWIKIKLVGVKSNRSGIGSRVTVTATTVPDAPKPLAQMDELRSGGSYFSQNDPRMHFGLDQAKVVDTLEIRWLSGQVDQLRNLAANQLYVIQEGGKILEARPLTPAKLKV